MGLHRLNWAVVVLVSWALAGCPADGDAPENSANSQNNTDVDMGTPDMAMEAFALTSISPMTGSVDGGTSVNLTGSGFESGMTVRFGATSSTEVVVITQSSATAVTPAGMVGAVNVTVENPDGATATLSNAFSYVDSQDPTIGFCQLQAQSPVVGEIGVTTPAIYAIVFADGLTMGEGAGEFIEGELGWGSGADYERYTFSAMTYNTDKDGLNPGDLSNDEYGGSLQVPTAGQYRYVARFRTQQRADEWVYCDLDGSENGIAEDQLGVLDISEPAQPEIGFCQLQAQSPVTVTTGEATDQLYAVVFADELTPGAGQGSGIEAELGWGSTTDAAMDFNFVTMTYANDVDGINAGDLANDEYAAALTINTAGEYRYAARFKLGAESDWVYCDLDGSDMALDDLGVITVEDPPQPEIGFCQTQTTMASALTNQDSDAITALVFSAGITQGAGQGANVVAELLWGATGSDPMTWTDTVTPTYAADVDGLTPGDMANDQYTATINATMMGDYDFAYRFSLDAGATWTWCDTDGTPFEPTKLGRLEARDVIVNLPDACNVQFPEITSSLLVGQPLDIFGRVTEAGITGSAMADANLVGELLVGPQGADPVADAAMFTTVPATVKTMNLAPTRTNTRRASLRRLRANTRLCTGSALMVAQTGATAISTGTTRRPALTPITWAS